VYCAQKQNTFQTVNQKCVLCTETKYFPDGKSEMCTVYRKRILPDDTSEVCTVHRWGGAWGWGETLLTVCSFIGHRRTKVSNLMRNVGRIFLHSCLRQILKIKMPPALNSVCASRYSYHRKYKPTSNNSFTIYYEPHPLRMTRKF